MARLLISVRSPAEAEEALAGGAEVIDIKEPDAGPLGKVQDTVCREIISLVSDRRPVSAAMGEMLDGELPSVGMRLQFAKWGMARCATCKHWGAKALELAAAVSLRLGDCTPVFVAYADHHSAHSPPIEEVVHWCAREGVPV